MKFFLRTESLLVSFFLALNLTAVCFAETFTWTANTEADLSGYNLYQAPGSCTNPGAFAKVASVGKVTTLTHTPTVDGLYCWALTAFDTGGLESIQSNKVEKQINVNPPLAPRNFAVN